MILIIHYLNDIQINFNKFELYGTLKGGNKVPSRVQENRSIELKGLLVFADRTFYIKKDEYLFQEGIIAEEFYIVLSGKVQISKITSDGRELSLRICSQ